MTPRAGSMLESDERGSGLSDEMVGVVRLRLGQSDAHYGGSLVSGAKVLELFGDACTELAIRTDGDEGLLAAYESVEFLVPVKAGDFLEVTARLESQGKTSRRAILEAHKFIEPRLDVSDSAADILPEPTLVARGALVYVVKESRVGAQASEGGNA
jgi:3-aminobutyryl-CoA ammonia-lyase